MSSRQFDPLALSRGRYLPVESAMPGTTLEVIPMEASVQCSILMTLLAFFAVRYPPVESAMPGTTLEVIPMEVRHVFCVSWPG